jgi:hypothetical protein
MSRNIQRLSLIWLFFAWAGATTDSQMAAHENEPLLWQGGLKFDLQHRNFLERRPLDNQIDEFYVY